MRDVRLSISALVLVACGGAASTAPGGAAPGNTAVATAEVPTTAFSGPPLDPAAVPPGRGWHCYSTAPSLQCFRAGDACTTARDAQLAEADPEEGAGVYSECLAMKLVVASTARSIADGRLTLMFWTNTLTCDEDGGYVRGENPYYDQASGCAELP
ncbi:MAG: hypothetical protein R2939_02510 [Kofleriaceae bacterium]